MSFEDQILHEPVIGKNIIETLTLGMYTDSRIVFREYVQNATDSIDKAINQGLYENGEAPFINIVKESRKITIYDNGYGITAEDAASKLLDIGHSDKNYEQQRGFRGIGRLGGLAYCNKLLFKTSAVGESTYTQVEYDCIQLKKELAP